MRFLSKEFIRMLPEVTTSKINNKKNYTAGGLFSQQIFGPISTYTCECRFKGSLFQGQKCEECGVDIVDSIERRRRFAKIVLPFQVINPIMYDIIGKTRKLKNSIDLFLSNENSLLFVKDDEYYISTELNKQLNDPSFKKFDGTDAIKEIIRIDCIKNSGNPKWDWIYKNIDSLLMNEVIVLPPDMRQITKREKQYILDDINKIYIRILTEKETLMKGIYSTKIDKKIFYQIFKPIQNLIFTLYDYIFSKLGKKKGLIRGNILGKRIDFSGRAVIVPEPDLKLDECSLPYMMLYKMLKIQICNYLIDSGQFKLLSIASQYVDECINTKSLELVDTLEVVTCNEVCILNRQPSLTRLSTLGFKIKVNTENVIKIHPMICSCFNADFDGDQMAVYIPVTEPAKKEVIDKFFVEKNLFNPANGLISTVPNQDIILGVYLLTSGKIPNTNDTVKYRKFEVPKYTKIFNCCLPKDFPLIEGPVNESRLLKILEQVKNNFLAEISKICLDKIKEIGFKYSTEFGCTMSLDKFILNGINKIKNNIFGDKLTDSLQKIQSEELTDLLRKNFTYSYIIDSGSRGDWSQAKQLILARGFVSNFNGEIVPKVIRSSLVDGLTPDEFFVSTYGSRKGLLDVAINTGVSGYLSRKLVFSCINTELSSVDDCGTYDTLHVHINDMKKALMLVSRYYIDENNNIQKINNNNYTSLVGKTIKLRSPIYCKNPKLCKKCYGDYHFLHSPYVGIIAAQTLGERSTQLVLRTFHSGGIASSKKGNMKQDDIVADLTSAISLLHTFSTKLRPSEFVRLLYEIYNRNGKILHIHFEILVSQMMWKNSKKWRLQKNRDYNNIKYESVFKVPSNESWFLGLAFSNPKYHLIKGLVLDNNPCNSGILDHILIGKKIEGE